MADLTPQERLDRLVNRPRYMPRPTREEIVAACIAKLYADLAQIAGRAALSPGAHHE